MGREADEWNEVVERLREVPEAERWQSEDVGRLYGLALKVAPSLLGSFSLPEGVAEDFASELLTLKLNPLVDCTGTPFALLVVSLKNKARSWKRHERVQSRHQANQASEPEAVAPPIDGDAEERAAKAWSLLTAKEQNVFGRLRDEESREDIAARLATSRVNIDKIISRARKRLNAKGLP